VIADAKANPLDPTAGHKTLNYWWRLRELQTAAGRGAGEAIVLQVSNHVCGGCVSNLFAVKDGTLVTPIARGEEQEIGGKGAIPSPVLPGITRALVLKEAKKMGLTVERRMMGIGDVLDADEVFLTNSSWGVLPVTAVEAEPVGSGEVGEVCRSLRERIV
jgi:branched-subunit amino acid aminotransferase/4-amino-4-deoxychorismate lyase